MALFRYMRYLGGNKEYGRGKIKAIWIRLMESWKSRVKFVSDNAESVCK